MLKPVSFYFYKSIEGIKQENANKKKGKQKSSGI